MRATDQIRADVERSTTALYVAMQRLQEDPLLEDILWEVIEWPSLLGVLWSVGVRASLVPDFASARPAVVEIDGREHEAERVQVATEVNGEPAFFAEIVAVDPAWPLTATAGIWLIRGHAPSRPERTFELKLLAAQRGPRSGAAAALLPNGTIVLFPGATTLEVPD